jgi:DNA-binding beta-propeller fold protein YncE
MRGTRHLTRSGALYAGVLYALALATGCASSWTLRHAAPAAPLQWPFAPASARIVYQGAVSGLERGTDTASVLRWIVFGSDSEDLHSFVLPVDVAVGSDGRMAVADTGRRCVHLYVPATQSYQQLTGDGADRLVSPVALAFGAELRLYVADSAGKVYVFGADGSLVSTLATADGVPLGRPTGLAYSPNTDLVYVVDTLASRIDAFRPSGELAFGFGSRGEAAGTFNFPTRIAWSPRGELYVADSLNFRVQIFDEAGKPLGSFGHHGDGSGDFAMPKGIAVDAAGVVYVTDGMLDNVQLFSRGGEFLLTVGERGVGDGQFWLPSGAVVGADGRLYVCDSYNRRVQVFRIEDRGATDAS